MPKPYSPPILSVGEIRSKVRVLIVKTTSMGDIIHAFPALHDIHQALPSSTIEWVVEEAFSELPDWHPLIERTHQVAWRRWRKKPLAWRSFWQEWRRLRHTLLSRHYDCVIDAQALLKSTVIGRGLTKSFHGFAKARDPFAGRFYHHHHPVSDRHHAVERIRYLCAHSLGYQIDLSQCDFGLSQSMRPPHHKTNKEIFLLPNTSKARKTLPIKLWQQLVRLITQDGYDCILPGHTATEADTARAIASTNPRCSVLPSGSLTSIATRMAQAAGVIAVDTGLAHLATALGMPIVALFTVSNPHLFGCYGKNAINLFAQPAQPRQSTQPHPHLDIRHSKIEPQVIYSSLQEKLS